MATPRCWICVGALSRIMRAKSLTPRQAPGALAQAGQCIWVRDCVGALRMARTQFDRQERKRLGRAATSSWSTRTTSVPLRTSTTTSIDRFVFAWRVRARGRTDARPCDKAKLKIFAFPLLTVQRSCEFPSTTAMCLDAAHPALSPYQRIALLDSIHLCVCVVCACLRWLK